MLTQEEKDFIVNVLNLIQVNAKDPMAANTVRLVQTITSKLEAKEEE